MNLAERIASKTTSASQITSSTHSIRLALRAFQFTANLQLLMMRSPQYWRECAEALASFCTRYESKTVADFA